MKKTKALITSEKNTKYPQWLVKKPEDRSSSALRVTAATHKATVGLAERKLLTVDQCLRGLLKREGVVVK